MKTKRPSAAAITKEGIRQGTTTAFILLQLKAAFSKKAGWFREEEKLKKGIRYYASVMHQRGEITVEQKALYVNKPGRRLGSLNGFEGTPALEEAEARLKVKEGRDVCGASNSPRGKRKARQ